MAKVNIFFQELNYRTVDETPVYSVSRLGTKGRGRGQRRADTEVPPQPGTPPRGGP